METIYNQLLENCISTTIGGLTLTAIIILVNEFINPKKIFSGEWVSNIKIIETSKRSYENLNIEYKIHLIQIGYEIQGSGEKINETNNLGERLEYDFKNRVEIKIKGIYERRYLRKSKIYLYIEEFGKTRTTRATYILTVKNKKNLEGYFLWTAANANGSVQLVKQWLNY